MNRESREHWVNEILNEVFLAVIAWEPLKNALIFKGARILRLHLGDSRQSFDIDSAVSPGFVASTPGLAGQANFLEEQIPPALRRHFERQNPVMFKLGRVEVARKPPKGHQRGWMECVSFAGGGSRQPPDCSPWPASLAWWIAGDWNHSRKIGPRPENATRPMRAC
jgi:hypothetical protein